MKYTGIVIGFDPVSYNTSEPDGVVVTLSVRLLEGSISAERNILVRLTTADASAQGKISVNQSVHYHQPPPILAHSTFGLCCHFSSSDLLEYREFSNCKREH